MRRCKNNKYSDNIIWLFSRKAKAHLLKSVISLSTRSFGLSGSRFNSSDIFLLTAAALALLYGRWSSIIYPISLNPDEMQAAANALRILSDGFNWDSLDGTTVGPLNSMILIWPKLIGLDITLSFVRLTAYFLLALTCIVVYLTIRIFLNRWVAALYCAPLVFFYAYTKSPEFLHYSSELLPLLILSIANLLILSNSHGSEKFSTAKPFLLGVLLGAVPFSKLQAAPIAFIIGFYSLLLIIFFYKTARAKSLVLLILGSLIFPSFFLVPLIFSGHFLDFWNSYILWTAVYIKESTSILGIHSMIAGDPTLRTVTYFLLLLWFSSSLFHRFVGARCMLPDRKFAVESLYLALVLVVIFWAISKPGNLFPHYLMFFLPFLLIFIAHSPRFVFHGLFHKACFVTLYIFLSFACLWFLAYDFNLSKFNFTRKSHYTVLKQDFPVKNPNIFWWLPSTNNSLLVWGWMPQWYLLSNRTPATRESHTYGQIVPTMLNEYFRNRFLLDFERSNPDFVIDAVNGSSFGFNDPSKYSTSIFPQFNKILSSRYYELNSLKSESKCPRLYIRNDLSAAIKSLLINPKSVEASESYGGKKSEYSPENLFDNSLTEDSCIDFWLLPDNKLGVIKISLNEPESISQVSILATRNGRHIDRSARDVIVRFKLKDVVVVQRKTTLHAYPLWTSIYIDNKVAVDSIDIEVVSYNGLGAGLNEVKLFRAQY